MPTLNKFFKKAGFADGFGRFRAVSSILTILCITLVSVALLASCAAEAGGDDAGETFELDENPTAEEIPEIITPATAVRAYPTMTGPSAGYTISTTGLFHIPGGPNGAGGDSVYAPFDNDSETWNCWNGAGTIKLEWTYSGDGAIGPKLINQIRIIRTGFIWNSLLRISLRDATGNWANITDGLSFGVEASELVKTVTPQQITGIEIQVDSTPHNGSRQRSRVIEIVAENLSSST